MFGSLGGLVARRRRLIGVLALVLTLAAGIWGTGVFGSLTNGGFDDPASESARAAATLDARIARTSPDLVVMVSNPDVPVTDPAYRTTLDRALAALPVDEVKAVHTHWSTGSPAFVAPDGHTTYAAVTLTDAEALLGHTAQVDNLRATLTDAGYDVDLGGPAGVFLDTNSRVSADIARAESLSLPVLLILLVLIFGSLIAAMLPLAVGGIAILGSFAALRAMTQVTDVSIFAINVVTILGLGLAIDYGLLMVGRFREELAAGHDRLTATRRTVMTAGRTVAVSAATVAVSLAGLLLFPINFLRSMGFGGMAAVLIAAIAAVVVLPALLAMLGERVNTWGMAGRRARRREGRHEAPRGAHRDHEGFWSRLAELVMRRPVAFLSAGLALLAVLAAPFFGVRFGGIDERVLPASAESRQVTDALRTDFGITQSNPIIAAVDLGSDSGSPQGKASTAAYLQRVQGTEGVTGVKVLGAQGDLVKVEVDYSGESLDGSARELLGTLRSTPSPAGVDGVQYTGPTAQLVDRLDVIGEALPWVALVIIGATFVLLFLAFGSILLPIKAIALNLVTLAATLGVVTWIFQNGHLSGLLGFEPTGFVEATQPILVMAVVFGLSMDYEVFLLSRVREQYDRTGDNRAAVAAGMQRTGRIISSAALLIIVVIAAFSASSVAFIKLIGVAMFVAILLDALLVRMIIVPAAMRLMGRANWWLPGPLARVYRRLGIHEELDDEAHGQVQPGQAASDSPDRVDPVSAPVHVG